MAAPMAESPSGVVFIRDFVQLQVANDCIYGRVNQFYSKVLLDIYIVCNLHANSAGNSNIKCSMRMYISICSCTYMLRKVLLEYMPIFSVSIPMVLVIILLVIPLNRW